MSDRRSDQRYGRHTETRPGIPLDKAISAKFKVRSWGKVCQFNVQYKPGEIWLVHARRNQDPITKHYTLIGETPEEWTKKYKMCPLCPRMRSKLNYATKDFNTLEEMQENFLHLRDSLLVEKDWVANLRTDWIAGYMTLIKPIAFEPWKTIGERSALAPIPERRVKPTGMVINQHPVGDVDSDD